VVLWGKLPRVFVLIMSYQYNKSWAESLVQLGRLPLERERDRLRVSAERSFEDATRLFLVEAELEYRDAVEP
jgi:hypothetical protein